MPSNNTRRRSRSVNRRNRFQKTVRRSRSAEPYKNINAEKIGEGGFGVVSRPPARCAHFFSENSRNINQRNINSVVFQETYYKNPNYISKLTEYNDAQKELEIGNLVKNYVDDWRDYYCFIEFICEAPAEKHIQIGANDFQNTYAIAPYCGVTLESIITNKFYISAQEVCSLIGALKDLIYGIDDLHNIQIYHQDIHNGNVLFDSTNGKLRLIDFGFAVDLNEEKKQAGNLWKSNLIILNAIYSDLEGLIFDIIEPTLKFIKSKLETSELTRSTLKCLKEVNFYLSNMPVKPKPADFPRPQKNRKGYADFLSKMNEIYIKLINIMLKY